YEHEDSLPFSPPTSLLPASWRLIHAVGIVFFGASWRMAPFPDVPGVSDEDTNGHVCMNSGQTRSPALTRVAPWPTATTSPTPSDKGTWGNRSLGRTSQHEVAVTLVHDVTVH